VPLSENAICTLAHPSGSCGPRGAGVRPQAVSAFADYQKTYDVIGGAMATLLWFYVSGLAMLIGAELNTIIEHASPLGKDSGERVPPADML